MNVYDYTVKNIDEEDVPLSKYKGKVLLIVNTATKCGFTPQYEALQALYAKYKDKGFELLDFPCNQFMHQAPGTNQELADFAKEKYHTTFETFAKINVNGKKTEPLFQYLKKYTDDEYNEKGKVTRITWNFTKFLVNKKGEVLRRYQPKVTPLELEADIEKLLNE